MALDVLIRHQPAMLHVSLGRAFYTAAAKKPLSGHLEVWRGYYQSVRPAFGKMMINIDISATAFYQSGPLIDIILKILGLRTADDLRRSNMPAYWTRVERQIKGIRILVEHRQKTKRTFKMLGLTKTSARETVFKLSTDRMRGQGGEAAEPEVEMDIVSYFKNVYNINLVYPTLPCVRVGKNIALPMELCRVVEGQRYQKKLDERQTADMIAFTSQTPSLRANAIRDGVRLLNYQQNEHLQDFGMKVSNEMAIIKARVLPPPLIAYHPTSQEPRVVPRDGAWNLKGKRLSMAATLGSWGIVVLASEREAPQVQIKAFVRELIVGCTDAGMNVLNKTPPIIYGNPHGNIEELLKSAWIQTGNAVKSQPQLLVCILPNTGTPLYADIKRVTDTLLGVSSQCIQLRHTRDPKKQYCANVVLKINAKLGGINAVLGRDMMPAFMLAPTLVLGGDVSHPPPGDTTRPSIAALVGSMDDKMARFAATVRVQTARTETIADLADMTIELLKTFYQTCGAKPERIIFYRDGISEGQFTEVLKLEVQAIRAACARLETGYKPLLTFLVVQKRHHTRFFPMKSSEADGHGNCKPGTVIETAIVHPFEFDFYLQSHAGLLGTSRSTHYYVLLDDSKLSPDDLQDLSFKMCHLYARCTRSVSIVPPVYYAHLVAARARFHSKGEVYSDTTSADSAEAAGAGDASLYKTVRPELMRVMWFM
ncbi:Eukaryotic translation initiation factor 2C [Dissophora globulifera]|nr:Eukaryotic translation initiation factor 2C [Dissophora globulifera]